MQIHQIQRNKKQITKRRIGRGGKRGTYSGKGMKGQKSRAGYSSQIGFRGGDMPLWKKFPKMRGSTKKVEVKHRTFRRKAVKPATITFVLVNKLFTDGDTVSPATLTEKLVIDNAKQGAKIVATGKLETKVTFEGVAFTKAAQDAAKKAGATIK